MRVLLAAVAAFAALTLAAPSFAQNTTAPAAPAVPAATAKYTLDTPIETIAADPAAKAVLDANMPGLTTHAMYDQFKAMSLNQVAPMSGGKMSEASLAKTAAALAALK